MLPFLIKKNRIFVMQIMSEGDALESKYFSNKIIILDCIDYHFKDLDYANA